MSAFNEVRFPEDISYNAVGGPEYSTSISSTLSGKEYRNINNLYSRMMYDISYGLKTKKQIERLVAFFRAHNGRAIGFRFKDWCDYKVENQLLAVGDGVTSAFQLKKTYQSGMLKYDRIIYKPVLDKVMVSLDGNTDISEFSIDYSSGKITFDSPVSLGKRVLVDFEFDVPVRFDIDYLPVSIDMDGTYSSKNIILIEINL
jgi:uncharacterized protein (TIGR02217 family)